jgi:DNA-directed RNA polymerase specialized sigma54-like protein
MSKIAANTTTEINKLTTDIAVILNKVGYIENEVKEITQKLQSNYVTQDQFEPVKKVVYGLVTIILVAVVGALIGLVIIK